ncbi:multicopper oxidase domain-containing protein [Phycicoccus sp. 3266]|uniref:multicopper oxidase domain-containing protein n=1 Tax=Phycicoccus sp. 3266 TaxID=2817751 RepID=UPI002855FF19|nr:multicopper oxidase domain-containing protein [Phycicoccus sp. 3266]MDR6863647.1 FtsP/CotA-like multicopper oxidase with cupredoxin domain [Phycicoccus sp. 3266]
MAMSQVRVSAWRTVLIPSALVVAAAHVPITEDHFHEAPYLGVLFLALEAAAVALAVLLWQRESRWVYTAAGVIGGLAASAYGVSRWVGLPQIGDDVGNWAEPLGVVAMTAEVVLFIGGFAAASGHSGVLVARRVGAGIGAVLLTAGLGATFVANAAETTVAHGHASATAGSGYWDRQVGGAPFRSNGVTRTYYISADVVPWNYAPAGRNEITGKPFDSVANTYVAAGPGRIGSTYDKCLYRGYTDASFTHPQARAADQQYLGMVGPVIHAVVGDTIKVVFRNTCPFPAAVHPHGVFYAKDSEGAPYNDGTTTGDKADDEVPTGGTYTYTWQVPERAGPGPHDGSSVMWMYHSHTDEIADTYAGLMGPMVVTRAGWARPDGSPKDVDREIFTEFFIDNETQSPLLARNERRYGTPPMPRPGDDLDDDFVESNLKHSINGYLYGNMPMITVHKGQHVRWYVMGMGTETDLHTPHWHGNDVVVSGMRVDVVNLLPASMVVADMVPDNTGTWLFHCHVNDHIKAGMLTRYQVVP